MIVLDTNVISELFRPRPAASVIAWLETLTGDVAITAVTLGELLAGVRRLPAGRRTDALRSAIEGAVEPYRRGGILPFDEAAAHRYADVVVAREAVGMPISIADAQIASICLVHNATCATRNVKDFVRTGVQLIDPWSAL